MTERPLVFGAGRSLAGIATNPPAAPNREAPPAVVFLNSGLIHRVGPNRLYVRLARRLALEGHPVLRFDLSGIGDSRAAADRISVRERWVAECRAAMDAMAAETGAERFLLAGNCSGAAAAYLTARDDDRVVGLGLVNLQGRALVQYYLRLVIGSPVSWRRLFQGTVKLPDPRVVGRRVASRGGSRRTPSYVRGFDDLARRGVDMLLVNSEWDPGYDYFHKKHRRKLLSGEMRERIHLDVIPGANHDLTLVANQDRVVNSVLDWADRMRETRWSTGAEVRSETVPAAPR